MTLICSAIIIADSGKQELPLRRFVLIYPSCFKLGVAKQFKNYVEQLDDETYDSFWYENTIFNIETFCSDFDEITHFQSRIKIFFEKRLEGNFVNILNFKNTPVINEIEAELHSYDFPRLLQKIDCKLGPLV